MQNDTKRPQRDKNNNCKKEMQTHNYKDTQQLTNDRNNHKDEIQLNTDAQTDTKLHWFKIIKETQNKEDKKRQWDKVMQI